MQMQNVGLVFVQDCSKCIRSPRIAFAIERRKAEIPGYFKAPNRSAVVIVAAGAGARVGRSRHGGFESHGVLAGGKVIADSRNALTLRESDYAPVQYIPRADVDMTLLARTDNATYCPYKGDAAYYSIAAGGERAVNAVWTYEAPYEAVAAIKDHLAFYPNRVDEIEHGPG